MRRRRGWSDFDTDEKLEALRADVNRALDLIEELRQWKEQTDATNYQLQHKK
jgi:hypothetical protein